MMKAIEKFLELFLWNSRHLTLIAIFASMLLSLGVFLTTTIDTVILGNTMLAVSYTHLRAHET
jgi:uncharacterized membrane protein YqhA